MPAVCKKKILISIRPNLNKLFSLNEQAQFESTVSASRFQPMISKVQLETLTNDWKIKCIKIDWIWACSLKTQIKPPFPRFPNPNFFNKSNCFDEKRINQVGENLESVKTFGEQVKIFEFQISKIATKIGTDSSFIFWGVSDISSAYNFLKFRSTIYIKSSTSLTVHAVTFSSQGSFPSAKYRFAHLFFINFCFFPTGHSFIFSARKKKSSFFCCF